MLGPLLGAGVKNPEEKYQTNQNNEENMVVGFKGIVEGELPAPPCSAQVGFVHMNECWQVRLGKKKGHVRQPTGTLL